MHHFANCSVINIARKLELWSNYPCIYACMRILYPHVISLLKVSFIMCIIEMHISYCISMSMKIEGKANLQIYFWAFVCKWRARWKSSYGLERIAITWGNLILHFICIWLALLIRFLFSLVFVCLFFVVLLLFIVCCFMLSTSGVVCTVGYTVNITDSVSVMQILLRS